MVIKAGKQAEKLGIVCLSVAAVVVRRFFGDPDVMRMAFFQSG
jgi:hypothetical protein